MIYPAVTSGKDGERKSILATQELWDKQFPGRVAYLHGGLSDAEKEDVIRGINAREFDIIVASIILEVGLTLPSLKALVAVDAERFGLSQLHQLRGRVARTGGTGYFFAYMPGEVDPETEARLQLLERHADGYSLAEHDLELRGCGDLSADGDTQHGHGKSGLFVGVKIPYGLLRQIAVRTSA